MKSHIVQIIQRNDNGTYEQIGTAEASENIEGIFKSGIGSYTLSFPSDTPAEFKVTATYKNEDVMPFRAWVNFNGLDIKDK